jgi:hypothetical protein
VNCRLPPNRARPPDDRQNAARARARARARSPQNRPTPFAQSTHAPTFGVMLPSCEVKASAVVVICIAQIGMIAFEYARAGNS